MNVKQLLDERGRQTVVEVRTGKGTQLLFSDSPENFSKNGYVADRCNNISLQSVMNLNVVKYFSSEGCNSIIIETE